MKKILITGSDGLIGRNLIKQINKKYKIYELDRKNCDLKYKKKFPTVDFVIHLAAFNSTVDFYNNPIASLSQMTIKLSMFLIVK